MEDRRKAIEANSARHRRDERNDKRRTVRETEQTSYSEKNRKGVNRDRRVGDGGGDGGGDGDGGQQGEEEKEKEQEPRRSSGGAAGETLKVVYLNAQSIVKKVDELGCAVLEEKPDLILMRRVGATAASQTSFYQSTDMNCKRISGWTGPIQPKGEVVVSWFMPVRALL
jgi:hypothetical protein